MAELDMVPGQRWGYRARAVDRVVEVEVLRVGTKRPVRVLVRFVDDDHEGRTEWVPPARLKVAWSLAADWQACEDRWQVVRDAGGIGRGSAEEHAADLVFASVPEGWDLAELGEGQDLGVLTIRDRAALCTALDVAHEDLEHPAAFHDTGGWVVPWPVTEVVVRRLARQVADTLLVRIREDDATAAEEARWGSVTDRGTYFSPEICRRSDEPYARGRDLARWWCGDAAAARIDELVALRDEVRRLGLVAEEAISALHAAGASSVAARLEDELGVPVEVIRASRSQRPG